MGSTGESNTELGLIFIGIFNVSLHGLTSNFDIISANPVLVSIIANRIPVVFGLNKTLKQI